MFLFVVGWSKLALTARKRSCGELLAQFGHADDQISLARGAFAEMDVIGFCKVME
jgi:hypothetical protein